MLTRIFVSRFSGRIRLAFTPIFVTLQFILEFDCDIPGCAETELQHERGGNKGRRMYVRSR